MREEGCKHASSEYLFTSHKKTTSKALFTEHHNKYIDGRVARSELVFYYSIKCTQEHYVPSNQMLALFFLLDNSKELKAHYFPSQVLASGRKGHPILHRFGT